MALTQTTSRTTTLRISNDLRDKIFRLAEQRGTTMVDVVADAVHRISQDEWWLSVRRELDDLTEAEVASYQVESHKLDEAAADGLDGW